MQIKRWGQVTVALPLGMNLSATILIVARIWYVTRHLRRNSCSLAVNNSSGTLGRTLKGVNSTLMARYWRIIRVVVESAALAAFMQTVEVVFYFSDFPGVYFVADSTYQISVSNYPHRFLVLAAK